MPDILAHPHCAFSPIHGTYPKFRRPIEPMPASPTRISPKPRNPSTRVDRARRGNRPRYRRRHPPISAAPPAPPRPYTQEGRPPFRTTGLPNPIYRSIESLSTIPTPRGKALAGGNAAPVCGRRTIRRRTWPSGAPGDRNARWRPSRCARTARRRAPGTRGSGGCSGPRS